MKTKLNFISKWVLLMSIGMVFFSCEEKSNKCATCPTYKTNKKQKTLSEIQKPMEVEAEKENSSNNTTPTTITSTPNTNIEPAKYYKNKKMDILEDAVYQPTATYGGMETKSAYHLPIGTAQPNFNNMQNRQYEPNLTQHNTEAYDVINENKFLSSKENPLSTFSIDVDNASYTNTRRFINNGSLPPKDAVRIEEFINYFSYDYTQPKGEHPFSINTEIGAAPWNKNHKLVHIGLQGKKYEFNEIEPFNLVFLIDVSGSMSSSNKLPLLKQSYNMLVNKMRPQDRIAIVVYAGAAGVVLPSTSGNDKQTILNAISNLEAGGSTAGGQGIKLAYKIAKENFIENGVNRVLLATDGDFNIGASSDGEMTRLVEENRDSGVYLTVLGFGMGNYKDSKMETIADNGNGNYFYIDNIQESKKVMVDELGSTLYTIAKDVKLQVEFNPNKVQAYRLIGYVNRKLNKEDFNDDKKDAGELGAGHTVTALYEIIPVGVKSEFIKSVDELKYQIPTKTKTENFGNELLTVKFRYKKPNETVSKLITYPLKDSEEKNNSENFNFSAAVAGFGMILTDSEFKQEIDYATVLHLAYAGKGIDSNGYRTEFIQLVKTAELLSGMAKK